MRPFDQGLWAYEHGLTVDDNPYDPEAHLDEYHGWQKGWRRAQMRDEAEKNRERIKRD